ncbi:MAG: tryptophan synthase subunit alpha [Candidatus Omnitrophica bacterium]|nr:tryptophan synthase subunit alpha [Candidatus Omnitrophota bacterium]MCM8790821.1 tryptophan synthase subunit alpha [Candidatus Omnitrophota bacterium]
MNRIESKFNELKTKNKKAFIAYITAGDPDLATTQKIALALEKAGVDIIELGVPFSDPLADGPVIQAASQRALAKKVTMRKIFAMSASLRKKTEIPLVFMTYYNPVLRYGLKNFFYSCRKSGVDGVIVPDLPHEEAGELIKRGHAENVATIFLVAPTSTKKRVKDIVRSSKGFVYYVSLTGVTGARKKLPQDVAAKIRVVKSVSDKPLAVGFGVSTPKQAAMLAKIADGVIVGSAIVKMVGDRNALSKVSRFVRQLSRAIHEA